MQDLDSQKLVALLLIAVATLIAGIIAWLHVSRERWENRAIYRWQQERRGRQRLTEQAQLDWEFWNGGPERRQHVIERENEYWVERIYGPDESVHHDDCYVPRNHHG